MILGMLAQVSTLLRMVGLAAVALDAGHEGGLLAADKRAGAETQLDVEGEAGAEYIVAEETVLTGLLDGDLESVDGDWVLGADIDVALVCADGVTGDRHGLEDHVGVALKDAAVHERARVALVGVAADVLYRRRSGRELPLEAGREAGAAASAEAGLRDDIDDLFRRHLCEDAAEGLVTVDGYVLVDVFGVYDAAVAKRDAGLLFIEFRLGEVRDDFRRVLLGVEKTLHDPALDYMLGNYLADIVRGDARVHRALGVHDDYRPKLAEAEAARLDHLDLVGHALGLELGFKPVEYFFGVRR